MTAALTLGFVYGAVSAGGAGLIARLQTPEKFHALAIPPAMTAFACELLSFTKQHAPLNSLQIGFIAPAPLISSALGAYDPNVAPQNRRKAFLFGNAVGGIATLAVAPYVTPVMTLAVGIFSGYYAAWGMARRYRAEVLQ